MKSITSPNFNKLFTVGYAGMAQHNFIALMQSYGIDVVVDVRSMPFSRVWKGFNRDVLRDALKRAHIQYVFLGDLCGARMDDTSVYINGILNYDAVQSNALFQKGLQRILNGLRNYRPVLMCAEKDPLCCHRFLLICRQLADVVTIYHIRNAQVLESQMDVEQRLLCLHQLDQAALFDSATERLQQAYAKQYKVVFGGL